MSRSSKYTPLPPTPLPHTRAHLLAASRSPPKAEPPPPLSLPRAQVKGSWKVWPLAHAINFRFIPSSQRVLYINSIQIGYNCFLSIISSRD